KNHAYISTVHNGANVKTKTLPNNMPLFEAADVMEHGEQMFYPVVKDDTLIGVLSYKDIVCFLQRTSQLVNEVMASKSSSMSLITLVIAILIAVPLGLLLSRFIRFAEPIIGIAAVMQTIPSLAVLAFLIPIFGIGTKPAIVALTAYGLLPILRNTYTGIKEVNPSLKEAATGMGMNSFKR